MLWLCAALPCVPRPRYKYHLPGCHCENFRNGLTTADVGKRGCAKKEVQGLDGVQIWCSLPQRPFIPFIDSGCPSDQVPCRVEFIQPKFLPCQCDQYSNGATPSTAASGGLCVKAQGGEAICTPRYASPADVGNAQFYGCPEDTRVCVGSTDGYAGATHRALSFAHQAAPFQASPIEVQTRRRLDSADAMSAVAEPCGSVELVLARFSEDVSWLDSMQARCPSLGVHIYVKNSDAPPAGRYGR